MTGSLLERARAWLAEDPDPATAAQLDRLIAAVVAGDPAATQELSDAFAGPLPFGTAGLRGRLGPGPNRMNRTVVIRAAAGLAAHLRAEGHAGHVVVVGYDARHGSHRFAQDCAEVLAGAGLAPLLLPRPLPTPVVPATVVARRAAAGIVVTASHNPPQDNGLKVYLADGAQLAPPADTAIAERIAAVGPLAGIPRSAAYAVADESVVTNYLDRVLGLLPEGPRELTIAYTALHGVGGGLTRAALAAAGFPEPLVVAEQEEPDPDFPTLTFPNPEEPGTLDRLLALATEQRADLAIAHDPDADRCAVAVPDEGAGLRPLTGDELGVLLGWWIIERGRRMGRPVAGTFACSVVSSRQLAALAAAAGLGFRTTLTGFKWIARAADDLVFGYEEALGYCVDPTSVRDKDGISAALLVAELAAVLKREGRTVRGVLGDLAAAHGAYSTAQVSVRFAGPAALPALMARLRARPPDRLGGLVITDTIDLARGTDELPPTDGLLWTLAPAEGLADARVIVRPSGTEPKVKAYVEVRTPAGGTDVAQARRVADERRDRIVADLRANLAP